MMKGKIIDLTRQKFGQLTVIGKTDKKHLMEVLFGIVNANVVMKKMFVEII